MVDALTLSVVGGFLLLQTAVVLYFFRGVKEGPRSPTSAGATAPSVLRVESRPAPKPSRDKGAIRLPASLGIEGTVELWGDVVIEPAGASTKTQTTEIDVPTAHVDTVLKALRGAGFRASDSGVTVDTDEGEEMLTTLELDLESLQTVRAPKAEPDLLRVHGSLTVELGATVYANLQATGSMVIRDGARVVGDVRSEDSVVIGTSCVVEGAVDAVRDVRIGPGSSAESIRTDGEVWLADIKQGSGQIRASRITLERRRNPSGAPAGLGL